MTRWTAVLVLVLLSSTAAWADEATVVIEDDGSITATVTVGSAPDVVLARVGDPEWVSRTSGDPGTAVTIVGPDGGCQLLDYVSSHPLSTASYRVRQCPVTDGFQTKLVSSDAFSKYQTSWDVQPHATGSTITYRLDLISTLKIPGWMVRRASRKSVESFIANIGAAL